MINKPENPNYCATVVKIKNLIDLAGFDNLKATNIFGYQVLVGKDTDTLGVFFPAETQLSDMYCYKNNLYRHGDKNEYPDKKGFFEDNRRVRAIKFKGNTSNGFFMPLSSLEPIISEETLNELKEGDSFDTLDGVEICRKYVVKTKEARPQQQANRGFVRADKLYFPEHIDTENFFRNLENLDKSKEIIVTQKLHGTSIRIANTLVNRKKTFIERVASFFGAHIQMTEYANLYGSRKVIKDANNPNQAHYYDTDIWTMEGKKLDTVLPENYIVYAELVGWTPEGAELQRDYNYAVPKGQCEMYVYRIAIVNGRGQTTDLSWDAVKEFCTNNAIKHVPELWRGKLQDFNAQDYMDVRYYENGHSNAVWLGDPLGKEKIVDEGVCIRFEGLTPKIYKAKAPLFLEHETKILDTGEEDLESSQSNV